MRCFPMNPRFFIIWVLRPPNGLFGAPRRDLRGGSLGSPRGVGRGPAGARDGVRPGLPGGSGGGSASPRKGVGRDLNRDPLGTSIGTPGDSPRDGAGVLLGTPRRGWRGPGPELSPPPPAPCSRGWASGGWPARGSPATPRAGPGPRPQRAIRGPKEAAKEEDPHNQEG